MQALEALAGACSSEALQDFLKDKKGKVLGETRLVHFIDTGGQAIYHDVHPVLITSPSVYLVVFSLSELCKKSPEERIAYFRSGLIQRPLRSIYTFGTKAPRKEDYVVLRSEAPKILVVGTHLDQVPLEDSGMERFLDDISRMIEKEISNKPYRQFVQYDTKGRSFWAVDNTLAGKESEGVKKYNTGLRRMVQEGSTEMSVKVPLPWMLMKLVMDGMGVRYCKYSQLLEEACSRGYVREDSPDSDLDTMLWLFHVLGLIYHKMPKGCRKEDSLVFIDPDCLYTATSDFLMAAKEEIEDSSEAQQQTQAASMEEPEDNQRGSEECQHQIQAVSREETEDNQGGSEEVQHQTQAASTEKTEDNQRGSEEGQHQTQAVSTEETEDNQGDSVGGQHQTQADSTEETEDNQGDSMGGQHQTQAASMEETEDNQGDGEEGQHQTQAVSTEETEDNQGDSVGGQHQTQADSTEETEDNQGDSMGGQHQTQAVSTEKTADNQGDSEEGQHQTQAVSREETEDNQRGSEEVQHQTQAASTEGTEDNQGGSEEGQHQTQAVSTEKTADNQGDSEEGQHQTQAVSTEKTEDNQGDSMGGQHQTKAASTEKTADNQRGSEEGQHQTQAVSREETEDNQGGSEEVQHQTQAASTEKTEDNQRGSEEGQHQTQAVSTEKTADNQGDSVGGQHQTQAVSTEKTADNQRGSEEVQHQTQADFTEETEDNQGDSEEGQHQTQAASMEETEDNQGGSEEGQHLIQAVSREETEDNQGGGEEVQHQTQAASTEKTEDNQRGSEEVQHQTQAASTEKTEDNQRGSEEVQHQTQAVSTEKTADNQGDSEEGQHQTQAVSTEKTADNQGDSVGGQHQTQADSTEETEDNQRGSEEGQHQTQAASMEETEDNQGGSEEGQHQTQAASTEETADNQGDSEEGQHHGGSLGMHTQAASMEETEDNQGDSEEGQQKAQAASSEEIFCDKEMAGERGRQQKQEANRIVQKRRVIERIRCNSESIKTAIEAELHTAEQAIKQEATEDVLTSLHDQLKKIEQQYKLPARDSQDDAASVKAKQQLYIRRLVKSLANSVKAVLGDAGGKGDVHRVRREVGEAVESIRKHYQGRSIDSQDMDQVLSILSDLRIVAKLSGSDRYMVPAALPEVPHSLNISGSADPILVTVVSQTVMEVCFLPSGLFCCLISELVTKLGWTVEPLGRTHVAFTHEDLTGVVHVVEHESYIEIKLESPAPLEELPKTCQNVRTKIHKHIVDVYKTLYSDPTADSAFEESLVWGFRCEEHPGDDTHIAAFEEDDYECCAECLLQDSGAVQLVTAAQRVWGLVTLL